MDTNVILLVVLSAVLILTTLILTVGLFGSILFISRDTTKIPEILTRLTKTEDLVTKLSSDVNAELVQGSQEIWKSADGKYTANSFEELLSLIANDPDGPLSSDEINSIKSAFEKIMGESDDDEDEPWKK